MIDFRYHVVSLVSVFLALAVGIVLGAGPLKDPFTQSLVSELTQQNKSLTADKDAAQAQVDRRDQFLSAVSPSLISNQLGGRTVVLVLMPGADTGLSKLTAALKSAGAIITGRVSIKGAWSDPTQRTFRDQLATQLQDALPGGAPVTGSTDQVLAALLARATVTAELVSAGRPDTQGQTILEGLQAGKLISVDGSLTGRATEALLIAAPVVTSTAPSPTGTDEVDAQVTIAGALDGSSSGAVAEGPPSAASAGGLLAAIRGDDTTSAEVSTVDTGGTPMGDVATVLALRQQLRGEAGSYGFGAGADRPLPDLPKAP
jgi:hypothetical protein